MLPTLKAVAGADNVILAQKQTVSEDFSCYGEVIPALFFFLGVTPKGTDPSTAPSNHSPRFYVDESALLLGVRSLAHLTIDYLQKNEK